MSILLTEEEMAKSLGQHLLAEDVRVSKFWIGEVKTTNLAAQRKLLREILSRLPDYLHIYDYVRDIHQELGMEET